MQINEFPGCCAGIIAHGFGGTTRIIGQMAQYTKEELIKFFLTLDHNFNNRGFIMLTLNDVQIPYMQPYLKKFKYELLVDGIESPNHKKEKSTISIYIKYKQKSKTK